MVFVSLRNRKFLCENFKRFLKALAECRFVHITVGYLSPSQKSSWVSRIFAVFIKSYVSYEWFGLTGETSCKRNKYFCLIRENKCSSKANFLELPKNNEYQHFRTSRYLVYEISSGSEFGFTNLQCQKIISIKFWTSFSVFSLIHSFSIHSFSTPKYLKVFWCFRGVRERVHLEWMG